MNCDPRWFGRPATKPGYGDPEPVKPVSTMDSPENVEACLNCPLSKCQMNLSICPLWGKGPARKGRRAVRAELIERDRAVRDLMMAGWKSSDIREKLGVGKSALEASRRRLGEQGEIG